MTSPFDYLDDLLSENMIPYTYKIYVVMGEISNELEDKKGSQYENSNLGGSTSGAQTNHWM